MEILRFLALARRAISCPFLGMAVLIGGLAIGLIATASCQPAASPPPAAAGGLNPTSTPMASSIAQIRGSGVVNVMYAGSLVTTFEKHLGPSFDKTTGFTFQGEGKGSVAIANLIKGQVRTPDVFVSADPSVNALLQGPANGNYVSWWVPFVRTDMVLAWSPQSHFAGAFQDAKDGKRTWESALEEPNVRLGRTDPSLDPKGYRTLWLFELDGKRTGDNSEEQRILGSADNPAQIFPEEQLVARLQMGQLDAGIFYRIEAVEANLPYLELPASINQGDPAQAAQYASVSYTDQNGTIFKGSPILYTVTIPSTVKNRSGAEAFVQYLLTPTGQNILTQEGLLPATPVVSGDPNEVPASIRPAVKAQ